MQFEITASKLYKK